MIATVLACIIPYLDANLAAKEPQQSFRRYQEGPLKIQEFTGVPDETLFGDAYTATSVEFRFRYKVRNEGKRFVARLIHFDAYSVFLPERSWWKNSASPSLLDHEQGHFDIAETTARRIQLAFDKSMAGKKWIESAGDTSVAATRKLRGTLTKVIDLANARMEQENRDYDRATRHGMRFRDQSEFRGFQKRTLERLEQSLKQDKSTKRNASKTRPTPDSIRNE